MKSMQTRFVSSSFCFTNPRLILIVFLALGGWEVGLLPLARGQSSGDSKPKTELAERNRAQSNSNPGQSRRESSLADIGPAPPVELTDAQGKPFNLARLQGKAVLVSFVYTTCTGSCPATTFNMTRVQRKLAEAGLWSSKVEFVSISLDPVHDTPERLVGYTRNYRVDPAAWHFLTGPPDQVAKVIAAWGMWVKPSPTSGQLDHPSRIFLVDPRGRQREIYNLDFLKPTAVLEDVQTVLAEAP